MTPAPALIEVPFCTACDSDGFLVYEDFIPARTRSCGQVSSSSVNYTCTRCEQYSGHGVPEGWSPPGWFWYA